MSPFFWFSLLSLCSSCFAKSKPNIIFILADDLGWNDVGYHDSVIQTPNIDRLAAEGVKLENYYVTPICTPTRSVLMTGRYQFHLGMQHHVLFAQEPRCLPLDEVTLPQKLKESGYATHMVGKWHLGFCKWDCVPNHRGFDTFFGFYLAGGDYFTHTRQCHGHKFAAWDLRDNNEPVGPKYENQYSTMLYAQKAQEVIRRHNSDRPLFLYLSFQAVHSPLQVPEQYSDLYANKLESDEERRIYAGMTTCMDEAIGNVTRTLKETGLWNNSVIVFSTDNGGSTKYGASNWPLRGSKGSLYEGGVRGPGFVTSPLLSQSVRGTATRELLYVGDWLPTFVHLAGGTTEGTKPLDGVNQWETISQGTKSARKEIVHNIDPLRDLKGRPIGEPYTEDVPFDVRVAASIRVGHWKLLTGQKGSNKWTTPSDKGYKQEESENRIVVLYNIMADPEERHDLSTCRPDIVNRLLTRLSFHNKMVVLPEEVFPNLHQADPLNFNMSWTPWL
ncbi:arylsulfatase B-like [Ptychodera flava]|uniref:arylsulfatase B-like n=1 Tax=Ptychodera flava TaxID=63121 RepID=UPI00396A85A3